MRCTFWPCNWRNSRTALLWTWTSIHQINYSTWTHHSVWESMALFPERSSRRFQCRSFHHKGQSSCGMMAGCFWLNATPSTPMISSGYQNIPVYGALQWLEDKLYFQSKVNLFHQHTSQNCPHCNVEDLDGLTRRWFISADVHFCRFFLTVSSWLQWDFGFRFQQYAVVLLPAVSDSAFSAVTLGKMASAANMPLFIAVWVPLIFGTFMKPGLQPIRIPPGNVSFGMD